MPETRRPLRTLPVLLALIWTAASIRLAGGAGSEQQIPLSVVKLWASAFGGEIRSIAAKYSGSQLLQKCCLELSELEVCGESMSRRFEDLLLLKLSVANSPVDAHHKACCWRV
ncbi:voltage-dependent calcium channel subunit alpha-2/delta-3 [Crotalus tigris]|uniref:voltage-dependent calcium channel subunit alpha-2/delta-3 n=1 Tax=Crotalus tigris TaxID=88082 RepID=UPI00192F886D|nr:voltage-dependent calcium channel subunit alpha-2/delta-3 [Crotalus tigris]